MGKHLPWVVLGILLGVVLVSQYRLVLRATLEIDATNERIRPRFSYTPKNRTTHHHHKSTSSFPQVDGRDRLTWLSMKLRPSQEEVEEVWNATLPNGRKLQDLSSVNYRACCGLGHRLARMANAAEVAKAHRLSLRTFWGVCGDDVEIFQYLFGLAPREELLDVESTHSHIQMSNRVPHYLIERNRNLEEPCSLTTEQVQSEYNFYKGLRQRFRQRDKVNAFVSQHFENHFVVGMHVRAGNGEGGHFQDSQRFIRNETEWVQRTSNKIVEIIQQQNTTRSPLLFIATDTRSMVDQFRTQLKGILPVLDWPQERPEEGSGVFFGAKAAREQPKEESKCLQSWTDTVMDVMLLSHVDVLFAPLVSSFTQSLPMSLVLGTKTTERPFCELSQDSSAALKCSKSMRDWYCHTTSTTLFAVRLDDWRNVTFDLMEERSQEDRDGDYRPIMSYAFRKRGTLRHYFPPTRFYPHISTHNKVGPFAFLRP